MVGNTGDKLNWWRCFRWGFLGLWIAALIVMFAFAESYGSDLDFGIKGFRYLNPISIFITLFASPFVLINLPLVSIPLVIVFFEVGYLLEFFRLKSMENGNSMNDIGLNLSWGKKVWGLLWKFIIFTYVVIAILLLVMNFAKGLLDALI